METSELLPKVSQIVPEGFVDLIRRVAPGATTLALLHVLTRFPRGLSIGSLSAGGLILFLLLSYETGLVLDALADMGTRSLFVWYVWRDFCPSKIAPNGDASAIRRVLKLDRGDLERPSLLRCRRWKMPGLLTSRVRAADASAALVLPKLTAEEFLLKNLAVGILCSLVLLGLLPRQTTEAEFTELVGHGVSPAALIGVALSIVAILLVAAVHRAKRAATRTREWARLLDEAELNSRTTEIKAVVFDLGGVLAHDV